MGEVTLKDTLERAPAFANGETSSTPAGGLEVSVALEAPAGSSCWEARPTVANVTTARPCSRKAARARDLRQRRLREFVGRLQRARRFVAQLSPAAPSGHGGWTIECTIGGRDRRRAVRQRGLARERGALDRRPAAQQRARRDQLAVDVGAPRRTGRAVLRRSGPPSSISHTFVIGGSVGALVCVSASGPGFGAGPGFGRGVVRRRRRGALGAGVACGGVDRRPGWPQCAVAARRAPRRCARQRRGDEQPATQRRERVAPASEAVRGRSDRRADGDADGERARRQDPACAGSEGRRRPAAALGARAEARRCRVWAVWCVMVGGRSWAASALTATPHELRQNSLSRSNL